MYRMKKRTPVSAYRLFASPSNKQIVFVSFYETPCSLIYEKSMIQNIDSQSDPHMTHAKLLKKNNHW